MNNNKNVPFFVNSSKKTKKKKMFTNKSEK